MSVTPLGAILSEKHPQSLHGVARAGREFHYLAYSELQHTLRTGQPAAEKYYGMPRLLILETLVPPGDQPHPSKALGMLMLGILGGKERSEQEYRDLLDSAGFTLDRVLPTPSPYAILEAVLR